MYNNHKSRTKNVARNATVSLFGQVIEMLFQFIGRTIFIYVLGKDYLGINGLFSNILTILAFAELGIGNAMVFSMYKPLAENDTEKLKSLMKLYKKAYISIGCFILTVGLILTPFLDVIIKSKPNITENIKLIYILYLLNTASSYFFVYKKSIIIADQKSYIVNIYQQVTIMAQIILQAAFLLLTHNFIVYLIIQISITVVNNVLMAKKANNLYPYLKESAKKLPKAESVNIFKNIGSLACYKFGGVILNGTDNIIISAMFSIGDIGLVSNYILIESIFIKFLGKVTEAFTSSLGNLNVSDNPEKQYDIFNKLLFMCAWMYGFASIGMLELMNDFLTLWIGTDYVIPFTVIIALVSSFYVSTVQYATYSFRTTYGLFRQGKFAPILAAATNIFLSVFLGYKIGLCGVFFATAISRFAVVGTTDAILIFTKKFKKNPLIYFGKYFSYILLFILLYMLIRFVLSFIAISGILGFIIKAICVSVLFNGIMLLLFCKTKMFKELFHSFLSLKKHR